MKTTFTLQVNDRGAWRNVVTGDVQQMSDIEHHAAMIAKVMGEKCKWRIIDAAFGTPIGYCQAPEFEWKAAE